jgi:hypothetical protein
VISLLIVISAEAVLAEEGRLKVMVDETFPLERRRVLSPLNGGVIAVSSALPTLLRSINERNPMFERFRHKTTTATVAALLAALGVGGVALAQPGSSQSQQQSGAVHQSSSKPTAEAPGTESSAPENSAADPDNIQNGDQIGTESEMNDASDKSDANEKGEQESTNEQESSSEVPDDDGPGGHADEPGNPNADHQAQGQE